MSCHDAWPGNLHSQNVQPFVGFFVMDTSVLASRIKRWELDRSSHFGNFVLFYAVK